MSNFRESLGLEGLDDLKPAENTVSFEIYPQDTGVCSSYSFGKVYPNNSKNSQLNYNPSLQIYRHRPLHSPNPPPTPPIAIPL